MTPEELLERTLEAARLAPVDSKETPPDIVREAILRASYDDQARGRRMRVLGASVVMAVLVGVIVAMGMAPTPVLVAKSPASEMEEPIQLPAPEPSAPLPSNVSTEHRLASRDRLLSSPGAVFDVHSDEQDRVVELEHGDMLFDVAHGGTFTVLAGDVHVRVLGTVFSVLRNEASIAVRVFDGVVAIVDAGGNELGRLSAGELWASGPIPELDSWRARSEEHWLAIAPEGVREGARELPAPHRLSPAAPMPPSLREGRALLASGDFQALLELSEGALADGAWRMLHADALRGLRRSVEAANAYEEAAALLAGLQRIQAAVASAQLWSPRNPAHALEVLRRFRAVETPSALEERARAMEIRLLVRLGQSQEALEAQLRYRVRFPQPTLD